MRVTAVVERIAVFGLRWVFPLGAGAVGLLMAAVGSGYLHTAATVAWTLLVLSCLITALAVTCAVMAHSGRGRRALAPPLPGAVQATGGDDPAADIELSRDEEPS